MLWLVSISAMLERGIAVRQGQRFLRAELPRILATPPDFLSPGMVCMTLSTSAVAVCCCRDSLRSWAGRSHQSKSATSLSQSTTPPERSMIALAASAVHVARQSKSPAGLLLPESPIHGLANVSRLLALGCETCFLSDAGGVPVQRRH